MCAKRNIGARLPHYRCHGNVTMNLLLTVELCGAVKNMNMEIAAMESQRVFMLLLLLLFLLMKCKIFKKYKRACVFI
jgi:hypothetical protein